MTNKLRQFLIAAHGESPDVSDRLLELTYPKEVAAFEAGENANALAEWHDLRKKPDDLPTDKHFKITSDGDIAFYDWFLGKWYDLRNDELTYQPFAWCKIPKFEEGKNEN